MEYICIGKIVNTFGIKGELKIQSYSDFDALRYKKGNTVYVRKDGKYLPFRKENITALNSKVFRYIPRIMS